MLFECIQVAALRRASILIVCSALLLCRCLWWRWLPCSCCCCCCKAQRLCELHLTDGSIDLLHHLQSKAGLEPKNGTRYSFVSHSKESLWLLRWLQKNCEDQTENMRGETEVERDMCIIICKVQLWGIICRLSTVHLLSVHTRRLMY